MYRLPAQSISTTDIIAIPHGDIAFSPLSIIRGIHSALVEKSYPQRPDVCSLVLEGFGGRILERIQHEVTAVLLETGHSPGTDWDSCVLRPVIAKFDIVEELGVCKEDSEYIFLLVTALSLAFELLLLAGRDKASRARTFLARAFRHIFIEPEICRKIVQVLDVERARLMRKNAEIKVSRAIQGIQMLIPDEMTCAAAWDKNMLDSLRGNDRDYYFRRTVLTRAPQEPRVRVSMYSEEAAAKFFRDAETFASLRHPAANPLAVEVRFFLRYGCCWLFNFVTSVDHDQDRSTMTTSEGLTIALEAGCSVSPVPAFHDRLSVTMPAGSINGFSGRIYIPPYCSYRVDKVENVREKTSDVDWTLIETANGAVQVGGDGCHIRRVNVGTRVIFENVRG